MPVAVECRSRCAPAAGTPALVQARRTTYDTLVEASRPCGGRSRTNTAGQAASRGRPPASQLATASPASAGNGSMSRRLPLPRTVISPCRQQMSPRSRAATSPARKPSRASSTKIAKSRRPAALSRSQLPISRARSAGLTARGSAASCQHAADGTAPASGALICPSR